MKRTIISIVAILSLASCSSFVSDWVIPSLEYDANKGLESLEKSNSTGKSDSKKARKEQQKLKKEGKCLVCRGAGRSIDGKYVCTSCNGTGKATAEE